MNLLAEKITLWVVRDKSDGSVLFVSDRQTEAEDECTFFLDTFWEADDGSKVKTRPQLECYGITLGRMLRPPEGLKTVKRRVQVRRMRALAEDDQNAALFRDLSKGGAE